MVAVQAEVLMGMTTPVVPRIEIPPRIPRRAFIVRFGDGDLGRIASASVVFDSYAQDTGGDEPWTLLVNGVEAAEIPPDRRRKI